MKPIKITISLAPVTKKNHGQIVTMGGKPRLLPSECTSPEGRLMCDTKANNMWEWKGLEKNEN